MKYAFYSLLAISSSLLQAYSLDIVANASKPAFSSILREEGCEIRSFVGKNSYDEEVVAQLATPDELDQQRRILLYNLRVENDSQLLLLEPTKLSYLLTEPFEFGSEFYDHFGKVYTWDDRLVDNKKFFKVFYNVLTPMLTPLLPFDERKLCAIVCQKWVSGWCPDVSKRKNLVHFFETKPMGELDVYGHKIFPGGSPLYKGAIPGITIGDPKIRVLSNYRFAICFENSSLPGYITEKIFAGFAAGCVPIYWGAPNIENYIPKDCYISYTDFQSDEELYQYLKAMTAETHENYLNNIRNFLNSEAAQLFTAPQFINIMRDAAGMPLL